MAFAVKDRVKEISSTTGTGSLTLGGAVTGYQSFNAALSNGDTTYYVIENPNTSEWETGVGTFTSPSTLARTTVLSSSTGSAVSFTAGAKNVFISLPATQFPAANTTVVGTDATQTLTNKSISGASNTVTNVSLTTGVTGTLPVANGGTGVTSSTGTGSVVLSASPTLTGTLTAAAATYSGNIGISVAADATAKIDMGTSAGFLGMYMYHSGASVSGFGITSNTLNLYSGGTSVAIGTGAVSTAGGSMNTAALFFGTTTTLYGALTYGGVTLSNSVTGTGSMVLSASPTLTGTLSGAAASFTANMTSQTLNVNHGSTTSISTVALTNTGAAGINIAMLGNGATTPAKYLRVFNGNFEIVNNAYSAAIWSLTDAGNMGVGGTSTLTGATTMGSTLTYGGVTLSNSVTGTGSMVLSASPTLTGTVNAAAITTSGAISAGTTVNAAAASGYMLGGALFANSDASYVYIRDSAGSNAALLLGGAGPLTNFYRNTTHNFQSIGGAATFATINSSGLTMAGPGAGGFLVSLNDNSTNSAQANFANSHASGRAGFFVSHGSGGGSFSCSQLSDGHMAIENTGTQTYTDWLSPLRIVNALTYGGVTLSNSVTGTGSMVLSASPTFTGTGVTINNGTTARLLVGTTNADAMFEVYSPNGSATACPIIAHDGVTSGALQFAQFRYGAGSGTVVGSITGNTSGTTAYNTSSDIRLKTNFAPATSASKIIDAIAVEEFDWKSSGERQRYGMVAQRLVEVYPEAVWQGTKDGDMWAVDYSKLVPVMVKEIQELRSRVKALEA